MAPAGCRRPASTPRPRHAPTGSPGGWNRFVITVKGGVCTVVLNGQTVTDGARLPGAPARGPIGLDFHGGSVEFANLYVRELGGAGQ